MWIAFLCFVSRGLFIYHKCKNQNAQNQEFKSQDRLINVNYVTSNLNINDENDWLCHFKLDHVCAQWAHWIRYLLSASHSSQRGARRERLSTFFHLNTCPKPNSHPNSLQGSLNLSAAGAIGVWNRLSRQLRFLGRFRFLLRFRMGSTARQVDSA